MKNRRVEVTFEDGHLEVYLTNESPFEISLSDDRWQGVKIITFFLNDIEVGSVYID